jgi:hypothetical protein
LNMAKKAWIRKVDRHLLGNSWDLTWEQMEGLIKRDPAHPQEMRIPAGIVHV